MYSWEDLEKKEALSAGSWETVAPSAEFVAMFGNKYAVHRKISDRVDGAVTLSDQKEILVKVTWENGRGIAFERSTATWFTKGGLHDYLYRSF